MSWLEISVLSPNRITPCFAMLGPLFISPRTKWNCLRKTDKKERVEIWSIVAEWLPDVQEPEFSPWYHTPSPHLLCCNAFLKEAQMSRIHNATISQRGPSFCSNMISWRRAFLSCNFPSKSLNHLNNCKYCNNRDKLWWWLEIELERTLAHNCS